MDRHATIYGLKNKAEEVVYVGRTRSVWTRQQSHRYWQPDCEFVEFEKCWPTQAPERERAQIQKYAQLGQAQLNSAGKRPRRDRTKLKCVMFRVSAELFRAFKVRIAKEGLSMQDWGQRVIERDARGSQ